MKDTFGRRLYSLGEFYKIYYLALFSAKDFIYAKKKELLSEEFIERIMLSVTEVNGCSICSYAHTKMALEAGMSNEEIQKMLAGVIDDVPEEEISGVLFAQHYADKRGNPSKESWDRIVDLYGNEKAKGILGTTRMIMFGNAAGIPWGSFINRFKRQEEIDDRSNLIYEIAMILVTIIYLPIAIVHALSSKLLRRDLIKFRTREKN